MARRVASSSPTDAPVVDALTGRQESRDLWIDVLRAVAALMVVVSHAMLFTGYYIGDGGGPLPGFGYVIRDTVLGQGGVVLFFSLSGYLIARPFLRALLEGTPLPDTRSYLRRRFARILPAYWLALLGGILMFPVDQGHWPSAGGVLLHALFLNKLFAPTLDQYLIPVGWTLVIEVMFYLLTPTLAHAVRRRMRGPIAMRTLRRGVAALWLATSIYALFIARFAGDPAGDLAVILRDNVVGRFYLFCPGLLVALWSLRRDAIDEPRRNLMTGGRTAAVVAALLTAAVIASRWGHDIGWELRYQFLAVAAGLVLWRILLLRGAGSRLVRALASLGIVSYGIYLWHYVFIHALFSQGISLHPSDHTSMLGRILSWPASLALGLALALPCAVLSWKLVEKPLITIAARRSRRAPAPASVAVLQEAG